MERKRKGDWGGRWREREKENKNSKTLQNFAQKISSTDTLYGVTGGLG